MASPTDVKPTRKGSPLTRAAVLAVGGVFLFAAVAFADSVLVDGDGAAPVTPNFLNMGQVCSSGSKTKAAAVAIQATNHPAGVDIFAPGSTVTFSPTDSAPSLSGTSGSLVIPVDWATAANGALTPDVTVQITMRGGTIGAQASDWMAYTAAGRNVAGEPLSRTTWLNVRAAYVFCADTTPPALQLPADITAGATSASGAVVTFSATASDTNPLSPTVTCTPASGSTFPLGTTTVRCSAADAAGNTANGRFTVTVTDGVAPTVSISISPAAPNGRNGWYSDPVTVTVTANDNLAVASVRYDLDGTSATYGGPFAVGDGMHTVTATATDASGNTTTSNVVSFNVDTTAPTVMLDGGAGLAATTSSTSLTCRTIDALSGVATDAVLIITGGSANGVGTFTATCTGALDNAGNLSAPVSVTFGETYREGSGILPPIAPGSDRLLVRGQSVPVKFRLPGDENLKSGYDSSTWTVEAVEVSCSTGAASSTSVTLKSRSHHTGFRFSGDRYIFNANLRSLERGTCWQIRVTLDDGTTLQSGSFRLTGKSNQEEPKAKNEARGKSSNRGGSERSGRS